MTDYNNIGRAKDKWITYHLSIILWIIFMAMHKNINLNQKIPRAIQNDSHSSIQKTDVCMRLGSLD